MPEKYDFKYTLSISGSISGPAFMKQTEDAINDLGTQTVENKENTDQALLLAQQAKDTADLGLSTAQNAQTLATANSQSIITINTSLSTLQTDVEEMNTDLTERIAQVSGVSNEAWNLSKEAVLFTAQSLEASEQTQARANIGAAPVADPTFTGTVTTANLTVNGTLNGTANQAIADQLGNNIVDTYAPINSPNFTGEAVAANLTVTGTLTATVSQAIADQNGNNIADTYATKADTYSKSEVDAKLSSVYEFKGSVETYADLPTEGVEVGDTYNVVQADAEHNVKAGDNLAWTANGWDNLGGNVDLSAYLTTARAQATYLSINAADSNYLKKSDAQATYVPLFGGTMTGALILNADPTTAMGAATKQYVDSAITTGTTNAVLYVSQQLSPEQQTQARTNIGAISSADIPNDPTAQGIYEAFTEFNTENGIE